MKSMLLTDLYQLTMCYGYWKHGLMDREAVFHLFFRSAPFGGNGAIAAGVAPAADLLEEFSLSDEDVAYLAGLRGADDEPLFEAAFLTYLRELRWCLEVDAVAEGELVFANEPILRVRGPLLQCQLVETALLNLINFQTLVATKAAHLCDAAGEDPVFEFGLRRAQGPDGGLSASRAAFIGGCAGTSNVLAGKQFGIPVKGTHAHSWVMSFETEQEAFQRYSEALPHNAIFLVDTYDTIEGVRNAIRAGEALRQKGHDLLGIRLDSGDLAALSIQARDLLDSAGFTKTQIVASNDLDVESIKALKQKQARIDIWGVGTNLVTAADQPALGGVYKMGAIRSEAGEWQYRVKLSNDPIKVSNPGMIQVARTADATGRVIEDLLFNEIDGEHLIPEDAKLLLTPLVRAGRRAREEEPIQAIQMRAREAWKRNRGIEPVIRLEENLEATKNRLLSMNGFLP